jgi:cytochrome bd-type quinol oxidase subunit 1
MSISEDARFITLGPEVGSRIQSRELVLLSYMALSGTLLSAALTSANRVEFALAIPYLALASALLGMHHDLIIGVLSDFMKELSLDAQGPRWHHEPNFLPRALRFRTIRDVGAGFFKVVTVAASLFVTRPGLAAHGPWSLLSVIWWGGLVCGLGVLGLMVITWGIRNERPFARWFWSA